MTNEQNGLGGIDWMHQGWSALETEDDVAGPEDEAAIHEHAKLSGFPASKIYEVSTIIDPGTDKRDAIAAAA